MFSSPKSVREFNKQIIGFGNSNDPIREDSDVSAGYYIHQRKLGEGGFGFVRLATHIKTNQKVAIKMMNKTKLGSDLFRVYIEINALKRLNHENIAQLLQVFETEDSIYLVLEYCSGGELFDYLCQKTRLTEEETRAIMKDLFKVLDYIHKKGFAHRDLKPENILFDRNHRIKLIDFGLSAHCRDLDKSLVHLKTCCGSPAYAAPELLSGNGYSGPAVDVWSSGVLLYALLVGKLPFDDQSLPNLYRKIQIGTYEMPKGLSKEALNLINSMLQTDPNKRITIEQILSNRWFREAQDNSKISSKVEPTFEDIFLICCDKFPDVNQKVLRDNILNKYGYQRATYCLIRRNPQLFESLISDYNYIIPKQCVSRRRSKSFSIEPKSSENSPKIIGEKRKIDCETLKDFQLKRSSPNGCQKFKPKVLLDTTHSLANSPSRIPTLKESVVQSPKVANYSIKLSKAQKSNDCAVTPPKNVRLLAKINESNSNPSSNFVKSLSSKAPELLNTKQMNSPTTPKKKSLIKRLLESATPAKSQVPRVLRSLSDQKNTTLTKFTETQKCLDRVIEVLKGRGVQCTQKAGFTLRCVLSTMNTIVLTFSLEILIYEGFCVIQRKRLKGNSWDYKRICEDILKIGYQTDL